MVQDPSTESQVTIEFSEMNPEPGHVPTTPTRNAYDSMEEADHYCENPQSIKVNCWQPSKQSDHDDQMIDQDDDESLFSPTPERAGTHGAGAVTK